MVVMAYDGTTQPPRATTIGENDRPGRGAGGVAGRGIRNRRGRSGTGLDGENHRSHTSYHQQYNLLTPCSIRDSFSSMSEETMIHVRLGYGLKTQLQAIAKREKRSVSAQAAIMIEEGIDSRAEEAAEKDDVYGSIASEQFGR